MIGRSGGCTVTVRAMFRAGDQVGRWEGRFDSVVCGSMIGWAGKVPVWGVVVVQRCRVRGRG